MMAAGAVMARSVPAVFCKSPMANIIANRALPRAVAIASACAEARMAIVDKVNNPTARIVNKTISVSVITKAKAGARWV